MQILNNAEFFYTHPATALSRKFMSYSVLDLQTSSTRFLYYHKISPVCDTSSFTYRGYILSVIEMQTAERKKSNKTE